ncbi:hypothetical protein [Chitinophaga rhizosphaerae]|uniref:hypothetical protein n=1 Tax=Chitinophaga rhizosphaerae TaxID=1864947 RepID=UPI000F810BA9|nr:hypothetical protein [Chitinophaga rhizosphaerae]
MNFLKKIFNPENRNPYFIKLRKSLERNGISIRIRNAYFLFGIPYSEIGIEEIKTAIREKSLSEFKGKYRFDVKVDNIELYLVENTIGEFCIILLLDPYELYREEEILEIIPVNSTNFEKELIFSLT